MKTTKFCRKCKQDKDLSLFSKQNNKPDGLQASCKVCSNEVRLQWGRDNPDRIRSHNIRYSYGISQEQYDSMLREQGNSCKICNRDFGTTTPQVDHDHSCCSGAKGCGDCVRGLLCVRCNLFLGFFENFKFMESVLSYLKM